MRRLGFPGLMLAVGLWGCFGGDSKEENRQQQLCIGIICLNGGYCVNGACVCVAPWNGPDCSQQPNPCAGVTCLNGGTCVNGACSCPPQWTGPDCGTQVRPTAVRVTNVRMSSFPATDIGGVSWDALGGMPDVFFTVEENGNTIYTSGISQDLPANQVVNFNAAIPITFSNPTGTYQIIFWDSDLAVNDEMGRFSFVPYFSTGGFPASRSLGGGGFNLVLTMEYVF